ncbi:hypothetical protein ACFRFH_11925 [Leifsonia sp. NPDC056824]|uniref:hypothetical protein n=1 Tax=Leifsonia sp. NPDC056824 TaxID=3345953 RepID=UPI0036B37BDF
MEQTDSDVEIIEALDFEPDVACEWKTASGENADWYAICRDCKGVYSICESHRVRWAAAIQTQGAFLGCSQRHIMQVEDGFEFLPVRPAHGHH